jgi:hypothetical protein
VETTSLAMKQILFVCVLSATLPSAGEISEPETLRGLTEIQLVVEELPREAVALNVSKGILELDATKQLREGGITLLSMDERLAHPRRPYLYVNCNLLYIESLNLTSFSIDVEVHQRATLETGEKAQGLTWAKSYLGMTSGDIASERIRETVHDFVEEFIREATASPKAQHGKSL